MAKGVKQIANSPIIHNCTKSELSPRAGIWFVVATFFSKKETSAFQSLAFKFASISAGYKED